MKQSKGKAVGKIAVAIFALLLCAALIMGVTGAWVGGEKYSSGTILLNQGIKVEYSGFVHEVEDEDQIWEKTEVDFKLFEETIPSPGDVINLSPASIGAADGSIDFNVRLKLDYKFYADEEGATEISGIDYKDVLISTEELINDAWVLSTDNFYYLAVDTTLTNVTEESELVSIFVTDANFTVNPNIECEGPGFEIDGETIMRIDVILTVEFAQLDNDWEVQLPPPAYFNSDWKNLLATDVNSVATGITTSNIKTIEFATAMPEGYNEDDYILVGAVGRGSTAEDKVVNDSVLAYYRSEVIEGTTYYHFAIVGAGGQEIYAPINSSSLFNGLTTVTTIEFNNFITTGVSSLASIFRDCGALTSLNLSGWDVTSVTNMSAMFNGCSSLTSVGDLSGWQVGNVTYTISMFNGCSSLTSVGDLSGWQVGNVTNMSNMFLSCSSLTSVGDLSGWQVGNVTNMSSMFNKCSSLTSVGELSGWQVGNVTSMSGMFSGCSKSTSVGDLSGWSVGNVTNMISMFNGCSKLTSVGDLSGWQVVNVTNMSYMFRNCSSLTSAGDLSNWSVGNVTNMSFMFYKCSNLTSVGDLSGWQVGKVTDMSYMFSGSSLTSLDLSGWNLEALTNTTSIFSSCTGLTEIKAPAEIAAGMTLTLPTAPTGKKWVIEAGDGTAVTEIGNDTSITTLGETLVLVDA